jgi:hypothetical protein
MSVVETTIGVCQNDYCVCRQMLYNDRVGSDDPAFGERKNPLVGLVMHFTLTECWPVKPKLH